MNKLQIFRVQDTPMKINYIKIIIRKDRSKQRKLFLMKELGEGKS